MNRRRFIIASSAAVIAAPRAFGSIDLATLSEVTKTPAIVAKGLIKGKAFTHVHGATTDTHFSAASLTKPVFAMAVRRLVREGKLDWKKPLQDYLALGLTGAAAGITPEHVLTHATGLVNWRFDPKDELASAFPPGTSWGYSGEGYVLLQRVVEKIVAQPLGTYLNETLLPSLGMTRSTFTWKPDIEKSSVAFFNNRGLPLERSAVFYEKGAFGLAEKAGTTTDKMTYDEYIAAAKKFNAFAMPVGVIPNAAGSLWTTIDDYSKFVEKTFADIAGHPDEYGPRNRVNSRISWTLSWGVDTSLGKPGYFHWGDGPGVKNIVWLQPAAKNAAVIFTNSDHGASAYRWLLRRLLNADPIAPEWV